jgi:predicted N-acyltransferase
MLIFFSREWARFYRKRELTAVTVLPKSKREIPKLLHPSARTSMRKSLRDGVRIAITDDFFAFYEILKTNLRMRHNVSPTHTLQELLLLKQKFPSEILLFGAYYNDILIADALFL